MKFQVTLAIIALHSVSIFAESPPLRELGTPLEEIPDAVLQNFLTTWAGNGDISKLDSDISIKRGKIEVTQEIGCEVRFIGYRVRPPKCFDELYEKLPNYSAMRKQLVEMADSTVYLFYYFDRQLGPPYKSKLFWVAKNPSIYDLLAKSVKKTIDSGAYETSIHLILQPSKFPHTIDYLSFISKLEGAIDSHGHCGSSSTTVVSTDYRFIDQDQVIINVRYLISSNANPPQECFTDLKASYPFRNLDWMDTSDALIDYFVTDANGLIVKD